MLIQNNLLSSDENKNCIFYNTEKTYAYIRGINPNNKFVKSVGNTDFIIYATNNIYNPMYIFESPIDILSYINLYPTVQGCMVSINGSSMINKVKNLVDKHKDQLKNIYHCFDNDDQGNKFMEKIIEQTKEYNIEHIRNSPKLKDFNDDLINLKMGQ
jgi:hypothetical protein